MKKRWNPSTLKLVLISLIVFCGCKHNNLQKAETVKRTTGETVLLNMIGNSQGKPIEYTTVYSDGRYYYRLFQKKENTWNESSGYVPESILDKIKQKGLKSPAITNLDGTATYSYDFANSIVKHPLGIGELLGYISQKAMKNK